MSTSHTTNRRWLAVLVFISGALFGLSGCRTLPSSQDAGSPSLSSALFNALVYAHDELGQEFFAASTRIEVRVVLPQSIGKFVDPSKWELEGEMLRQVREVVEENENRALVVSILDDSQASGSTSQVVFLSMAGRDIPGFEDTNGVLISGRARFCSIRAFGMKGSKPWCGVCAVGICCGSCKCSDCGGDISSAWGGRDLPKEVVRLLEVAKPLDSYQLDVNLVDSAYE
jgi:hypothetical protein